MKIAFCFTVILTFFLRTPGIGAHRAAQRDSLKMYRHGRETFRTYCSSCHAVNREIVGPMLASVPKKRPQEWLLRFIRDSQDVIVAGDEYANFLYAEYKQNVMPSFRKLSDEEIKNILFYIETESLNPAKEMDLDRDVLQNANAGVLAGKQIFQLQCANCHFIDQEHDSEGPALGSVTKRRPKEWLVPFIRNSQKVIQGGDPYAVQLFKAFEERVMVPMDFLSEAEIISVLDYIEFASSSAHSQAGVNGRSGPRPIAYEKVMVPVPAEENENKFAFKVFFIVASIFAAFVHGFLLVKLFHYLRKEKGASNT